MYEQNSESKTFYKSDDANLKSFEREKEKPNQPLAASAIGEKSSFQDGHPAFVPLKLYDISRDMDTTRSKIQSPSSDYDGHSSANADEYLQNRQKKAIASSSAEQTTPDARPTVLYFTRDQQRIIDGFRDHVQNEYLALRVSSRREIDEAQRKAEAAVRRCQELERKCDKKAVVIENQSIELQEIPQHSDHKDVVIGNQSVLIANQSVLIGNQSVLIGNQSIELQEIGQQCDKKAVVIGNLSRKVKRIKRQQCDKKAVVIGNLSRKLRIKRQQCDKKAVVIGNLSRKLRIKRQQSDQKAVVIENLSRELQEIRQQCDQKDVLIREFLKEYDNALSTRHQGNLVINNTSADEAAPIMNLDD